MHRSARTITVLVLISMLVTSIFLGRVGWASAVAHDIGLGNRDRTATVVYNIAQVRTLIIRHPDLWAGHTMSVRGILEGPFVFCGESRPCPPATLGLIDTEDQIVAPDRYLPVAVDSVSFSTRLLRHIPGLRAWASSPQSLQYGRMAIYRLRVIADPALCEHNPVVLCYEGLVVGGA